MALNSFQRRVNPDDGVLPTIGKVGALLGGAAGTLATAGVAAPVLAPLAAGLGVGSTAAGLAGARGPQASNQPSAFERRGGDGAAPAPDTHKVLQDSILALNDASDEMRSEYLPPLIKAYSLATNGRMA